MFLYYHQMATRELTPLEWHPVWLSLGVAGVALLLAFVAGTLSAWFMAGREFRGKVLVEALLLLPLVLPPVVTGYLLLVLIGRQGLIGSWLERTWDFRLVFTPAAAVMAAGLVAFPLMYQSAKAAFLSLNPAWHDAARSLGASWARVFWTVSLPLAWPGLAAGAVLTFARALGEFGATIMVAGNISGRTTTMPTAIYMAAEGGDLQLAGFYAALLGVMNLGFLIALSVWTRRQNRW
jgi:molybdate transport system permease protein